MVEATNRNPAHAQAVSQQSESQRNAGPIERIVFFGTPHFAVPTLDALEAAGRTPALVVSQPTRNSGRGRRAKAPPVALWALERDLPLIQTDRVKSAEFLDQLRAVDPCVAIVVAFGQIFRRPLLELPRLGCMNLHASLLPAYRGASPITAAIQHGETVAGVSTMVMERGLDSGPVLLQDQLKVGADETAGSLGPRLSSLGADLVVETLKRLEAGTVTAEEQDHALATLAPMLQRSDGNIDWRLSAQEIHNLVRAFDPWPGTKATFRENNIAIKRTTLDAAEVDLVHGATFEAGRVLGLAPLSSGAGEALWINAGDGHPVGLLEVQRPGRKAVSARDFSNGERVTPGERFGVLAEPASS